MLRGINREGIGMNELTGEGERLVSNYLAAQENLERAKSGVVGAECALDNAETNLAKWLMPTDMKPGEKIAVWRGDSLFQVELVSRESVSEDGGHRKFTLVPKITVRSRGKHFSDLRRVG
jgi:hypothetical protein